MHLFILTMNTAGGAQTPVWPSNRLGGQTKLGNLKKRTHQSYPQKKYELSKLWPPQVFYQFRMNWSLYVRQGSQTGVVTISLLASNDMCRIYLILCIASLCPECLKKAVEAIGVTMEQDTKWNRHVWNCVHHFVQRVIGNIGGKTKARQDQHFRNG